MNINKAFSSLFLLTTFAICSVFITPVTQAQVSDELNSYPEITSEDDLINLEPQIYVYDINIVDDNYKTSSVVSGNFSIYNIGQQTAADISYKVNLIEVIFDEEGTLYPVSSVYGSDLYEIGVLKNGETKENFSIKIPDTLSNENSFALEIIVFSGSEEVSLERKAIDLGGNLLDFISFLEANIKIGDKNFLIKEGPTISVDEKVNLVLVLKNAQNLKNVTPHLKIFSGQNTNGEVVYDVNLDTFNMSANTDLSKVINLPTNFKGGVYTGLLEFIKDGKRISNHLETRYIIEGEELKPKIGEVSFSGLDQDLIDKFIVSVSFKDTPINYRLDKDGNFIDSRAEGNFIKNISSLSEEEINNLPVDNIYTFPDNLSMEVAIFDLETNTILDTKNISKLADLKSDFEFNPIRNSTDIKVVINLKQNGEVIDVKEIATTIIPKTKIIWLDPKFASVAGGMILVIVLAIIILVSYFKKNRDINNKNITFVSVLILSIFVAGSIIYFDRPENANAGRVYLTGVNIINPKPPQIRGYDKNERIEFRVKFNFTYCTNEWYTTSVQISEPALRGKPDKPFGPAQKSNKTRMISGGEQKDFLSEEVRTFNAPDKPGIYTFRYRLIVENGQNTGVTREGRVTFKVNKEDVCANIDGIQERVPARLLQSRNANGALICIPQSANIQCSASKNRLDVGESVTYSANRIDNGIANFNWYSGGDATGSVLKTQNNVVSSTYTTTYDAPGVYLVSVLAQTGNDSDKCAVGVSVGDEYNDQNLDDYSDDGLTEEDEYYVDDEGNRYPLDRNAPAGRIDFTMDASLTNTTCKGNWVAANVIKCSLYKNNEEVKDVEFEDQENLSSGSYQIKCIQLKDGTEIESKIRSCRLNPDVKEL